MGKRKLVASLSLSSWRLMVVVWLFLAMPWVCLQFVIVVFPDHTHLLHRISGYKYEIGRDLDCLFYMYRYFESHTT